MESGPGEIPPDWWDEARIDPATGRVILKKPDIRVHIRDISSEGDRPGQLDDRFHETCIMEPMV